MQNYSSATIEGFATHDPVVKKTKTGKNLCTFSLAINHYKRADEDPRVSYIEVEAWERVAEICGGNIQKGRHVMVIGDLRQDRWEGENGKTQSRIKVVADEVRFLENLKTVARPVAEAQIGGDAKKIA